MVESFSGYRYIKIGKPNGVLIEIWRDDSLQNDTDQNKWVKVHSELKPFTKDWKKPSSDHQVHGMPI